MFAHIDVNANKQLYCLIFFMNSFEVVSPLDVAREANGSGQQQNAGIATFPPLQQLLYTMRLFRDDESDLIRSSNQKMASQCRHLYSGGP